MSDEIAKAAQEVAKATGKAIDVVKASGSFVASILQKPLTELSGVLTDKIKAWRFENMLKIQDAAAKLVAQRGDSFLMRPVPLSLSVPLVEAASLVEDEFLQERWAALLVNFADEGSAVAPARSFVGFLSEMSSLEVRILETIYASESVNAASVLTGGLPEHAYREGPDGSRFKEETQPSDEVALALSNLVRLGCLTCGFSWNGAQILDSVNETVLGRAFVTACRGHGRH